MTKIKTFLFATSIVFTSLLLTYSCANREAEKPFDPTEIETKKSLPEGHKQFILNFYPKIEAVNKVVLAKHNEIQAGRSDYNKVMENGSKLEWLNKTSGKYLLGKDLFHKDLSKAEYEQLIDTLLFRVDIIPGKLVMAQAIVESGWGQSKFAKEINNYFGIHCYKEGCGQPPSGVEDPDFWVKSFPSIDKCIAEYMWILNCGHAYDGLRKIRRELKNKNESPNAEAMVEGLKKYSQLGDEYITLLTSIMKNYLPANLNAYIQHGGKNPEEDIIEK